MPRKKKYHHNLSPLRGGKWVGEASCAYVDAVLSGDQSLIDAARTMLREAHLYAGIEPHTTFKALSPDPDLPLTHRPSWTRPKEWPALEEGAVHSCAGETHGDSATTESEDADQGVGRHPQGPGDDAV